MKRKTLKGKVDITSRNSATSTINFVPSLIEYAWKSTGLTKRAFAKKLGVTEMTLSRNIRKEQRGKYPSLLLYFKAAQAAGMTMTAPKFGNQC